MNNKEEEFVVDKLDDKWKEIVTFLKNNKDVNGLGPLSFFTETICKFRSDKQCFGNAKTTLIFFHTTGELDLRTLPWRPCERSVRFAKKDKEAEICVMSRVKDEDIVCEQVLKLKEDKSGNWQGRLTRLNGKGQYETYDFDISRHGYVKSRTFKLTAIKTPVKERPARAKKPEDSAAQKTLKKQ